MNIIINGFHDANYDNLLQNIFKIDFIDNIFYIGTIDHIKYSNNRIRIFIFGDLNICNYGNYKYNSTPLDNSIINDYAECESVCMKMFDRLEFWINMPYERRKNYYLEHLRFWHSVINEYNINCYIGSNIPHEIYDWIIYSIIIKRNGKVLCPFQSEFLNRAFFLKNNIFDYSFLSNYKNKNEINSAVIEYFNNKKQTRQNYKKPFYMNIFETRGIVKNPYKYTETYNRLAGNPDLNNNFIYFPLHYQPEVSTSPLANIFVKQELIIELLDYYLPENIIFYVKEHPKQTEIGRSKLLFKKYRLIKKIIKWFLINFLSTIKNKEKLTLLFKKIETLTKTYKNDLLLSFYKIKNIKKRIQFIKTNIDSQELINRSKAVVTCTGTAAIEALIKEKPVLLFGEYIYNYAPGAKAIKNNNDAACAYDFIQNFIFNEKQLLEYLQTLYENSYNLIVDQYYSTMFNIDNNANNTELFNKIYSFIKEVKENYAD